MQSKRVIFRDDDVTPWTLTALKAVNQVQIDEGVPVTFGVIPARSFPLHGNGTSSSGIKESVPVTFGVTLPLAQESPNVTSNSSFNSPFAEYMRSLAVSGIRIVIKPNWVKKGYCSGRQFAKQPKPISAVPHARMPNPLATSRKSARIYKLSGQSRRAKRRCGEAVGSRQAQSRAAAAFALRFNVLAL